MDGIILNKIYNSWQNMIGCVDNKDNSLDVLKKLHL